MRIGVGVGRGGVAVGRGVARGVGVAVRVGEGLGVGLGVTVKDGSGRGVKVTLGRALGSGDRDGPAAPRSGGTRLRIAPAAIAAPIAMTSRMAMASPTTVELDRRTMTAGCGGRSIGSVGSLPRPLTRSMLPCAGPPHAPRQADPPPVP